MVNNPTGTKDRVPLEVTISDDGHLFDRACLLRSGGNDLQGTRYEGKYKRRGYSYPGNIVWNNHLYVVYASNKEDIQLTRVPVEVLYKKQLNEKSGRLTFTCNEYTNQAFVPDTVKRHKFSI